MPAGTDPQAGNVQRREDRIPIVIGENHDTITPQSAKIRMLDRIILPFGGMDDERLEGGRMQSITDVAEHGTILFVSRLVAIGTLSLFTHPDH